MKIQSGKSALMMISIIAVLAALIAGVLYVLFLSDGSPDPILAQSVQDEYSVPVRLKIMNISGNNLAYILPGEVWWGSGHQKLLYNLSNPKEAALAVVETLANNDAEALEFILSQNTKEYWARQGYSAAQILDSYRSNYKNMKEPYLFDLEPGEDDITEGMLTVRLIRDSGDMRFEMNREPDGTWKI